MAARISLLSGFSRDYSLHFGNIEKASTLVAKTVNVPAPCEISARPVAFAAATGTSQLPFSAAVPGMSLWAFSFKSARERSRKIEEAKIAVRVSTGMIFIRLFIPVFAIRPLDRKLVCEYILSKFNFLSIICLLFCINSVERAKMVPLASTVKIGQIQSLTLLHLKRLDIN